MPPLAISTRWNAFRHGKGETLVEEILALGFDRIELGYDLTADLAVGVSRMVTQNMLRVVSVHNFCPVPVGASQGHPELFELASRSAQARDDAVRLTARTIRFAAEMGAGTVVVHCGNIPVRPSTRKLVALHTRGMRHTARFERTRIKIMLKRDKMAARHLDGLYGALADLLPVLEENRVRLAIENLPTWESIPTEQELLAILNHFQSPWLAAWHDTGHGRIRQNLGFINHVFWFERLADRTAGMHIHDVLPPANDHLMPPHGEIDFKMFHPFIEDDMVLVLEPSPGTPVEDVTEAKQRMDELWTAKETDA